MPSPIKIARELRRNMTDEELLLWEELRAHRFNHYKFRRQHPIIFKQLNSSPQFFIADFYCAQSKLVIELDGAYHQFPEQKDYDNARDIIMKEIGLTILRIQNEELSNIKNVLQKIELFLK